MYRNLNPIFCPRSIAVIGASREKGAVGREILHNLLESEFRGTVYPVNPRANEIHSIKCYPSITDVPGDVDLAIIVVPAPIVNQVAEDCGKKGVKGLVVISAGFKELGEEGMKREEELRQIIKKHGMCMVGPNCMGVINTSSDVRMNATFARTYPRHGKVAFTSQSGALCAAILEHAKALNLGFSKFVSLGNQTDVSGNDLLSVWEHDPETAVILMYIEHFGNPRNFIPIARRLTKRKPVLAVKSGRTEAGARAAASHTGALAGIDTATDALFEQCGVLRAQTIEELFDYALGFSMQPLPKGNRVGIVTNAGGPAVMAVDALISVGLQMATFTDTTRERLNKNLPPYVIKKNPIDLIATPSPELYREAVAALLADDNVDALIVICVPPVMMNEREIANAIVQSAEGNAKPVLCCFMGSAQAGPGFIELTTHNIPSYSFPECAAKTLAAMYRYRLYRERDDGIINYFDVPKEKVAELITRAEREHRKKLSEIEVLEILNCYGFPIAATKYVSPEETEVLAAAKTLGYPVAIKAVSPQIVHKTEFGAVKIDIRNEEELTTAYRTMQQRLRAQNISIDKILVQEFVAGGREVIAGMSEDKVFGPVLMFGLGGIYVEIMKDVAFRLAPLTDMDAERMVRSIRGYPLLEGVRGENKSDINAIIDCLQRLSQLVTDFHEIEEVDINPIKVFEENKGCKVVDARIILKLH